MNFYQNYIIKNESNNDNTKMSLLNSDR